MSSSVERLWQASYHPARAFCLERGLYLLLACDSWLLMLGHAGRYGLDGFNVAHFAWLDRLIPSPTAQLYVGLTTASGLLAFVGALGRLPKPGGYLLCVCYTLSWAISLHDSYQHHYLLSWLLAFVPCLPHLTVERCVEARGSAREPDTQDRRLVSGAGLPLIALSCAIVYLFTAISKLSPLWQSGAVLRHFAQSPGPFSSLGSIARGSWLEPHFWQLMAASVVLLQLVVALALSVCVFRDASHHRLLSVLCSFAWLGSASFHLLTDLDPSFSIGWFSYYMFWFGFVLLAPSSWLRFCLLPAAWLTRRVRPHLDVTGAISSALVAGSCIALIFVAVEAELPGVAEAAAAVWVGLFFAVLRGHGSARRQASTLTALSVGAGLLALLASLTIGQVRFDYYRRAAGELSRMGRTEAALDYYRRAERHAPVGQSRQPQIRELEQRLSQQRSERHRQL